MFSAEKTAPLNVSLLDKTNVSMSKRGSFYDPFESSIVLRNKLGMSGYGSPLLSQSHKSMHLLHGAIMGGQPMKGLTVQGAAISFISTIIGAGIVSLPYVILQAGYGLGVSLHFIMILVLIFAVHLLLEAR